MDLKTRRNFLTTPSLVNNLQERAQTTYPTKRNPKTLSGPMDPLNSSQTKSPPKVTSTPNKAFANPKKMLVGDDLRKAISTKVTSKLDEEERLLTQDSMMNLHPSGSLNMLLSPITSSGSLLIQNSDILHHRQPGTTSYGFHFLERALGTVIQRLPPAMPLEEKWNRISEWLEQYHVDIDAKESAQKCGAMLRAVKAESAMLVQPNVPLTGIGCYVMNRLLVLMRAKFPVLANCIDEVQKIVLNSVYLVPPEDTFAEPVVNPSGKESIREIMQSMHEHKTYFQKSRELARKFKSQLVKLEEDHYERDKMVRAVNRAVVYWQSAFKRLLLRSWYEIRKLQRAMSTQKQKFQDEIDGLKANIEELKDQNGILQATLLSTKQRMTEERERSDNAYKKRLRELEGKVRMYRNQLKEHHITPYEETDEHEEMIRSRRQSAFEEGSRRASMIGDDNTLVTIPSAGVVVVEPPAERSPSIVVPPPTPPPEPQPEISNVATLSTTPTFVAFQEEQPTPQPTLQPQVTIIAISPRQSLTGLSPGRRHSSIDELSREMSVPIHCRQLIRKFREDPESLDVVYEWVNTVTNVEWPASAVPTDSLENHAMPTENVPGSRMLSHLVASLLHVRNEGPDVFEAPTDSVQNVLTGIGHEYGIPISPGDIDSDPMVTRICVDAMFQEDMDKCMNTLDPMSPLRKVMEKMKMAGAVRTSKYLAKKSHDGLHVTKQTPRKSIAEEAPMSPRTAAVFSDTDADVAKELQAYRRCIQASFDYIVRREVGKTTITSNEFVRLMNQCNLADSKDRAQVLKLFRSVTGDKDEMTLPEYVAALMKCSDNVYGNSEGGRSGHLHQVLENHLLAFADTCDTQEFMTIMDNKEIKSILEAATMPLRKLFTKYSKHDETHTYLSQDEFQAFIRQYHLTDTNFTYDACRDIFIKLQVGTAVDTIDYHGFERMVVAMSMYKYPQPFYPLQQKLRRFISVWLQQTG
eukprot:PhF_6_TR39690/c0_g1_i1/m.58996